MTVTINGTTGIVTPDIAVDGTTLTVDAVNNRVGIGTTTPFGTLQVRPGTNANFSFSTGSGESSLEILNDAGSANVPLNVRASEYKIKIQGTEKLRITSTGNVGIKNTSPNNTLTVGDGVQTSYAPSTAGNYLEIARTSGADAGLLINKNTGQWLVGIDNSDGANAPLRFEYAAAGSSHPGFGAGTLGMIIKHDGKVGIGTVSPNEKLDVRGKLYLNNGSATYIDAASSNGLVVTNPTAIRFELGSERLRIDSSGRLTSTRSTTTAYNAAATTNDSNVVILNSGAAGHATLQFQSLSGGTANTGQATISATSEGASTKNTVLTFGTRQNSDSTVRERLRITSAGLVGIGTDNPSAKLHVEGLSSLSTTLDVGGISLSDTTIKTYPTTASFQVTPGNNINLELGTTQTVNSSTPGGYNFVTADKRTYTKSAGTTSDIDRLNFAGFSQSFNWTDANTCKQYVGFTDAFSYSGINANGRTSSAFNAKSITLSPPDGGTQSITNLSSPGLTLWQTGTSTINITNYRGYNPIIRIFNLSAGTKTVNILNAAYYDTPSYWGASGVTGTLNATITNLYGLRLRPPGNSTGLTVTNNYGVYQEWSDATNYFAGTVNINTTADGSIGGFGQPQLYLKTNGTDWTSGMHFEESGGDRVGVINHSSDGFEISQSYRTGAAGSYKPIMFRTSGVERLRLDTAGDLIINPDSSVARAKLDIHSSAAPALNITFPDQSFYRNLGTVGPNDTAGNNSSNGGQYLHIRLRTVWNDSSMTMFRITGYYSYSSYTESYVGMYRYGTNSQRYSPYGQIISNQSRGTVHSMYNTNADPGYLVIVCDWGTNYLGLMIEHNGAGGSYGSYMQHDLEIIDTKRSTSTSAQW